MRRNFNWLPSGGPGASRSPRFWLQLVGGALAVLNGAALFFYLDPPGGTRKELAQASLQVRNEIAATRGKMLRLKTVAGKVQMGSTQSAEFQSKYFLPKRAAYGTVISEIQRIAAASGILQRDWVSSEEPIEGSSDLSLLNITGSYEGTYNSLMHFVNEVDRSPMLLMLDTLTAAPQQKGGQINTSIRFQTIIEEEAPATLAGEP